MVIDRRLLIEESIGGVKREMIELLDRLAADRDGFRYSIRDLFEVAPTMADRHGPVASATAEAIRQVIGREPEFICSPGNL